jgi:hydroxymethylglutaryl-CoA lyase
MIKIIDCPRDAIQGIKHFIPTEKKIDYLNKLLKVGFNAIDFGSFVSPKAIPQLTDTGLVADNLITEHIDTDLIAIVVNHKGALEASNHNNIKSLAFPFSISDVFLQKNIKASITEAFERIIDIHNQCIINDKELIVHISMAFGNPYGDEYSYDLLYKWISKLAALGIETIILSDTVGIGKTEIIQEVFEILIPDFKYIEFGTHLHSVPAESVSRLEAAYNGGCRRFDGALKGYGGCPMSGIDLVGNISTEIIIDFIESKGHDTGINKVILNEVMSESILFYEAK